MATRRAERSRVDGGEVVEAAQRHDAVELAPVEVDDRGHTGLAGDGEAPQMRPADQARRGAERQGAGDVDAAANAAIDQHRDASVHRARRRRVARWPRQVRRRAAGRHGC